MIEYKLALIMFNKFIQDPYNRFHEGVENKLKQLDKRSEIVADHLVMLACAVGLWDHLPEDDDSGRGDENGQVRGDDLVEEDWQCL